MGRGGLNMSEVRTYARAGSYVCLGRTRQLPLPRRSLSLSLPPHLRALGGGSAGVWAGDVAARLLDQPRRLPRHVRPHRPAPPASPSSLVPAHSPARAWQLCATSCALTPAALASAAPLACWSGSWRCRSSARACPCVNGCAAASPVPSRPARSRPIPRALFAQLARRPPALLLCSSSLCSARAF